jgi:hypothetical protein
MSTIGDRDAALTRDPMQQQRTGSAGLPGQGYAPQHQQYGGQQQFGGYGRPYYNRGSMWTETRPSFLTSEFLFTILAVIGIAITGATAADIDSRLATELCAGVVAAYIVSRGIAKAGSRSGANDPRDDLKIGDHH